MSLPRVIGSTALAGLIAVLALWVAACGSGPASSAAQTVTVDTVVNEPDPNYSDTTDYSDSASGDEGSEDYTDDTDYPDPYEAASNTYDDYISRFNSDPIARQISQSLAQGAQSLPGSGSLYCRIGVSTQYAGAVIIKLYLSVGTGMGFMVPATGSPVVQGEFTGPPSDGDPCSVSSSGQVSF